MTLSNNPYQPNNPHNRDLRRDEDIYVVLPGAPYAGHSKLLMEAYSRNCKHGAKGRNDLITTYREMTYEDKQIFVKMEEFYRGTVRDKLQRFGLGEMEKNLTIRLLHPVVAVEKEHREYHLYVDIVSKGGLCAFVDYEAATLFESGPASMQFYAVEDENQALQMGVMRLVSMPAFQEAMNKLITASFDEVRAHPRDFVALGWIMHAVVGYRSSDSFDKEWAGRHRGALEEVRLSSIRNFRWSGELKMPAFQFSIGRSEYQVGLKLDEKNSQPTAYLYEERY